MTLFIKYSLSCLGLSVSEEDVKVEGMIEGTFGIVLKLARPSDVGFAGVFPPKELDTDSEICGVNWLIILATKSSSSTVFSGTLFTKSKTIGFFTGGRVGTTGIGLGFRVVTRIG